MIPIGGTGGLSGMVSVENVRSVVSFLEVRNLEDRWGNSRGAGGHLEDIRDCADGSGQ